MSSLFFKHSPHRLVSSRRRPDCWFARRLAAFSISCCRRPNPLRGELRLPLGNERANWLQNQMIQSAQCYNPPCLGPTAERISTEETATLVGTMFTPKGSTL